MEDAAARPASAGIGWRLGARVALNDRKQLVAGRSSQCGPEQTIAEQLATISVAIAATAMGLFGGWRCPPLKRAQSANSDKAMLECVDFYTFTLALCILGNVIA